MGSDVIFIRNLYSAAYGSIDMKLTETNKALSSISTDAATAFRTLKGGGSDGSQGGFVDIFSSRISAVESRWTNLYSAAGYLVRKRNELQGVQSIVNERLTYLNSVCYKEDFELTDIVFPDEAK